MSTIDSGSAQRTSAPAAPSCLNCGAALTGAFCSRCGQRSIPAYPTLRELAGDTWQELTGYDGKLLRAVRTLLRRPGALTVEVLEGRRVRYVSPVRLYLLASLIYFVVAAAVPNVDRPSSARLPNSGIVVDPLAENGGLTPEEQEKAIKDIERAPPWARLLIRPMLLRPAEFRQQVQSRIPRVLFALVPVFALIVGIFYRRRRYPQHLVFALHLHTLVFVALTVREPLNFTGSSLLVAAAEVVVLMFIVGYALHAFRRVYGESWLRTVAKAAGIALIYFVACITGLLATVAWAAYISA